MSINTGTVPKAWKNADIVPIFKKGDASAAANYRPISLTCTICRLFERILNEDLLHFLRSNQLITSQQFGFLSGKSTELQLLECSRIWVDALDSHALVDDVNIDFAKAFDTVSHQKLLHKMKAYGISGNVLSWFRSFLAKRKQRVKIDNCYSEYTEVVSGIPQGTCSGPTLFLLYINDTPELFGPQICMYLFADDAKLFAPLRDMTERFIVQDALDKFCRWANQWQLKIAEPKCNVLTFGKAQEQPS
jgi:hypothetical protein